MALRITNSPISQFPGSENISVPLSNATLATYNLRAGCSEILIQCLNATAGAVGSRLALNSKILGVWWYKAASTTWTDLVTGTQVMLDRGNSAVATLSSFLTTDALYICTRDVVGGFYVDVTNTNSTVSVGTWKYSNAATTITGALTQTDNTASGGATFGQDGTITWTAPTDAVPTTAVALGLPGTAGTVPNTFGYWWKMTVDATFDASVTVAQLTTLNKTPTTGTGVCNAMWNAKNTEYAVDINAENVGSIEVLGQDTNGTYTLNVTWIKRTTGT